MKSYFAFFKKEAYESYKTSKLLILGILFLIFGVMNPAFAKLTPYLMKMLSEELASSGVTVGEIVVTDFDSWVQFFKNIPLALIVFVVMYSSSFTAEYQSKTIIPIITKGLSRTKILLSKFVFQILLWSVLYAVCFVTTLMYNMYFWEESAVTNLAFSLFGYWLFGVMIIGFMTMFSAMSDSSTYVMLGCGAVVAVCYILSLIPKIKDFSPIKLTQTTDLLTGQLQASEITPAVITAAALSAVSLILAKLSFDKKMI